MTRLEICTTCTFYKEEKCIFCGCAGKGVINDPVSRCPKNLWEDGWGIQAQPCVEDLPTEVEIMYWDENTQTNISRKEIKKIIEEKSNPLYVFSSEEEFKQFIKYKQMYQ